MLTPDLVTDRMVAGAGVDSLLVNHDLLLGVQFDVYYSPSVPHISYL